MKRSKMKKYILKMKAISPLILSPRREKALYAGLDFDEKSLNNQGETDEAAKIKIIYPFYSYQTSFSYPPTSNSYYIPGSSVKGAIFNSGDFNKREDLKNDNINLVDICGLKEMYWDDTLISDDIIILSQLYKFQNIPRAMRETTSLSIPQKDSKSDTKEKSLVYRVFFDQMSVEMIKAGAEFDIEVYADSSIMLESYVDSAIGNCQKKLDNFMEFGERLSEYYREVDIEPQEGTKKLKEMLNAISEIRSQKMIFLGGYKGKLGALPITLNDKSNSQKNAKEFLYKDQNIGLYVDKSSCLPYGLVGIELVCEKE